MRRPGSSRTWVRARSMIAARYPPWGPRTTHQSGDIVAVKSEAVVRQTSVERSNRDELVAMSRPLDAVEEAPDGARFGCRTRFRLPDLGLAGGNLGQGSGEPLRMLDIELSMEPEVFDRVTLDAVVILQALDLRL